MRCLKRNESTFWYALFLKAEPLKDEYGNDTTEYEVFYENPMSCRANISAARGETQYRQFGEDEVYDKVIVMDHTAPLIDERSILWIDRIPQLDEDGALLRDAKNRIVTPHDYVVKRVARSLNSASLAVSKVNAGG